MVSLLIFLAASVSLILFFTFIVMNMTTREFVLESIGKGSGTHGVEGYNLAATVTNLDRSLCTKIHKGTKKTFIDDYLKEKKHVPAANYNVLHHPGAQSSIINAFSKDKRHTIPSDIEKYFKKNIRPEVHTYKPNHKWTDAKVTGAFNLKGSR